MLQKSDNVCNGGDCAAMSLFLVVARAGRKPPVRSGFFLRSGRAAKIRYGFAITGALIGT